MRAKIVGHIFQGILVFIAWAITFSILISPGGTDGRSKWYFTLCWFTAPALIYMSMTPRFERTRKFANAYAFAALDILFCIFWFSAFVAVAAFNAASENRGAAERKLPMTNCSTFANGSAKKCLLSKVTVGLGSVICISFILTGAVSVHALMQYRKNGTFLATNRSSIEAQTKAHTNEAFSSNLDDDGTYAEPGQEHDEHALLHSTETEGGRHPGQRWDESHEDHHDYPGGGYDRHRPVRGDDDESYYGEDVGRRQSPTSHLEGKPNYPAGDYGYRGARS
ncbi:hypothetical protein FGG08_001430 [Glutinoglossum americanum]|uniref:MARVEL domain-containing protein n=1 Tax=Glutinoglossum americanum TaxID=1670608 RepID=A0A9P8I6Z3_9PEZI|nr:hypothetical protein FGG08_001430 [Glutinoglossum americanum]